MDNLERFLEGNLLMIIFCATVLLSLILFMLYLRCIINSFIKKRHTASSFSSSSTDSELCVVQRSSKISQTTDGENETETETTVLMIPQQDTMLRLTEINNDTESGQFFRLPSDRRRDSYFKFNPVDDLDSNELSQFYESRDTRPVTYFGRKGRRLYRKGTWEKALVPKWITYQMTENKENDKDFRPILNFLAINTTTRSSFTTIFPNTVNDLQVIGASSKEVLI